jgi:hypothetical protein
MSETDDLLARLEKAEKELSETKECLRQAMKIMFLADIETMPKDVQEHFHKWIDDKDWKPSLMYGKS